METVNTLGKALKTLEEKGYEAAVKSPVRKLGSDGFEYSGSFYVNGKRVARFRDGGFGGETEIEIVGGEENEKTVEDVRKICKSILFMFRDVELSYSLEIFLEEILHETIDFKEIVKRGKANYIFTYNDDFSKIPQTSLSVSKAGFKDEDDFKDWLRNQLLKKGMQEAYLLNSKSEWEKFTI